MADIGITLAGKLIEVVGSEAIRQIRSLRGYESELDDLKDTIITIRKVLLDAESKGQLSYEAQHYIQKLQDVVYDADDLLDEVRTQAELKHQNKDAKLSEKVRNFFSSTINTPSVLISMSREVEKIRKKLDGIASNHNTFGFSVDSQPIRERREDTCSYVYSDEVIVGREDDLNKVVDMLLDSSSQDRVSFLSIVGVGGLGKTTLAQLVFNDDRVRAEFPLTLWTCVSDENAEEFKVKEILAKILVSACDNKLDGLTMDLVHSFLGGKKYLIVLDDVWNEDLDKWLTLKKFLMSGGGGSKVLVTTRSERTAMVVNEDHKYELKGLSTENSWHLFEMTAFGEKDRLDVNYAKLITLGEKIVEQCSNVPLAIKVVGTLLYGQSESKWRLVQECGIAMLKDGDNRIMSILKLSYDSLESPLKACFSYCALFPKDTRINKERLIRLWMAQGYIVPLDVSQSLEDAGEEYISILLRRCFFQDVKTNKIGGVKSFKIHDLIHDVAQKGAGKGVVSVSYIRPNFGDVAHHLFHVGSRFKGNFFLKCRIRSYVRDGYAINFPVAELVEYWKFLRTLDLHDLDIQSLPNSIGELLHLRYLDLSDNERLLVLPDSVTMLYNLQTLNLSGCSGLEELPKDLIKLANLRHLDLAGCFKLSHMPLGLDKLSCLCVLTWFVVGKGCSVGKLENLKAMMNLRESIRIRFTKDFMVDMESTERYLRSMKHLEALTIELSYHGNHKILYEKLEPPPSLKALMLFNYYEATLPSKWCGVGKEDNLATFLPNLVRVELFGFSDLLRLPSFSKLLHLKSLILHCMDKLKYIEDSSYNDSNREVFFPSLEELNIVEMSELKGWWRKDDISLCEKLKGWWRKDDIHSCNGWQPSFSQLSVLEIRLCKKLTSFPTCSRLENLTLWDVNGELGIRSSDTDEVSIKLKEVKLSDLDYLKSLPTDGLISICIVENNDIESLSELRETFKGCVSLRSLAINCCNRLRSLDGAGWEHLIALDSLQLFGLNNLIFSKTKKDDDDDNDGTPWRSIGGRLRSLDLSWLDIKTIPQEMRHLTSLENLTIYRCSFLTALPKWISCLSSLRSLRINDCNRLKLDPGMVRDLACSLQLLEVRACPLATRRFRDTDMEELRHIPSVEIRADSIHYY